MKKQILTAMVVSLLLSGCLPDQGAFNLLSQKSKEITQYPFHVYLVYNDNAFQGEPLPIWSYEIFKPFYNEMNDKQPEEIFATYQFAQVERWQCFLLRHPNVYDINGISIWIYGKERRNWQMPIKIAEEWGDEGYTINVQAWIEDINKDGRLDIVIRSLEKDMDLDDPQNHTTIKEKDTVLIWAEDHFKDASGEYLPKVNLNEYQFKENKFPIDE